MVSSATLDALARLMRDGAELRLATDDVGYLRWMLELAPVHPAFEWRAQGPQDWQPLTAGYTRRFVLSQ